jgi:cell division protein FtsL
MRDFVTWGAALAFLLTALYAVTVHREVVTLGRSIGTLNREVVEQERRNENLALELSRLKSPGALTERARDLGIVPPGREEGEKP